MGRCISLRRKALRRVTIPWVEPATVPFYARLARVLREDPRAWMRGEVSGE
ncbi:MAG: hypothetical protein U0325_10145 [Polyangiales bacterium]